ncbi:MAG: T9SS type A sorting domain-containing protein [Crocinitomix sp.]|nr:T9SS type A sorting domain-containing protein [Crocinitomix sp.]
MKQYYNLRRSIFASLALFGLSLIANTAQAQLYSFSSHTFTNAGADGRTGPFLADCVADYTGGGAAWASNPAFFNMGDQGIQIWTVPLSADYEFEVGGAQGGYHAYTVDSEDGGLGAVLTGTHALIEGDFIYIVVGQMGDPSQTGGGGAEDNAAPGGGGGTFVYFDGAPEPLMAAGGGGAGASPGGYAPKAATTATNGQNTQGLSNGGIGGNGGRNNNGGCSWWAGAGTGWMTNGTGGNKGTLYDYTPGGNGAQGGRRPAEGALGGIRWNDGSDEGGDGGFGGGGGGGSDNMNGGGGGGYSGGGGGRGCEINPGGGGSFNGGIDQVNVVSNEGHGYVTVTLLCNPLVLDIPVTGVCDGEELYLSATSATGGTVTWSGGVTDGDDFTPPPGTTTTYTATSTSPDDCPFSIEIHSSPIPDITGTATPPSACEGAYITLTGAGGLAMDGEDTPYSWTGTGDVTPEDGVGFPAEDGTVTYTLIGTYLGCEGPSVDIILDAAPQPDVSGVADPEQLCLGDSYTLTGASDFASSYDWGGGIPDGGTVTPASAGTFIHFVVGFSDEGCSDTAFVTVIVNENPIVDGGSDVTICEGDEIILAGSGALSYTWDPTATDGVSFAPPAGITTYTVTGTDANDCSDDDDVVVTVIELPYVASAIVVDEYYGYDGSIDITAAGGSGDYIFSWSHGPTTEDVTGLTSGVIYTVSIDDITIDPGMCTATQSYTLARFIGLDGESISQLSAYPNPTNDQLTVTYNGKFNYEVTTLLGEVVAVGNAVDQEQLSMKDLADGTYIVKVTAGDDISYVQVVKQ